MYMESVSLFQSINPIVSLSNNRKETEKEKEKGKESLTLFFHLFQGCGKKKKANQKRRDGLAKRKGKELSTFSRQ